MTGGPDPRDGRTLGGTLRGDRPALQARPECHRPVRPGEFDPRTGRAAVGLPGQDRPGTPVPGGELLRHRLTRRGVTTTAGMLGASLAQRTASAAPSAAWVKGTARAAAQLAAGQGVERFLSAESAELFRSVLRAPGLLAAARELRPVHQGRRRRSVQGGGETVVQLLVRRPPRRREPARSFDTLVELDLPADSSGVERTIELIPSK